MVNNRFMNSVTVKIIIISASMNNKDGIILVQLKGEFLLKKIRVLKQDVLVQAYNSE